MNNTPTVPAPAYTREGKLYYYRPIAALPGVYKLAGHGAEDAAHRAFYVPFFTHHASECSGIAAGTPIVSEYIADRITADLKPYQG